LTRISQHAEELAELLDAGASAAHQNAETATLLALASSVRDHVEVAKPSDAFRSALRSELLVAAPAVATAPVGVTDRIRQFVEQRAPELAQSGRAITATAVGAAALAASGLVTVAQQALPGDLLYGVKGATEEARLTFSAGDAERGRLHLQFADERLGELEQGVQRLTNDLLADTLHRLDDEVILGADLLLQAFAASADPTAITDLTNFTSQAARRLTALTVDLPAEIGPLAEDSLEVLRRVEVQVAVATGELASDVCTNCGGPQLTPATTPRFVVRPGEGPAITAPQCDCSGPSVSAPSTPDPEPTSTEPTAEPTEPTPEPTEPADEPASDVGTVPQLPGPIDPIGDQVDELLEQLPVDPIELLPPPVQAPVTEIQDAANDAVGDVSKAIDDILP
jgi:hypothetical protein